MIYLLILVFLFSLLQATFLKLNLVLLLVLFGATIYPIKAAFWLVFLSGIFLDLASGNKLGQSSFYFLVLTFTLILYSRKFDANNPLFFGLYSLITALLITFLLSHRLLFLPAIILGLLAFLIRLIFNRYFK